MNEQDKQRDNWTALHCAAHAGNLEGARLLITKYQADPALLALRTRQNPLHLACLNDQSSLAEYLIEACPQLLSQLDSQGCTPLHYLCSQ